MARGRTRTAAPAPDAEPMLTLGFFGSAEVDQKTFIPLLNDLVDGRDVEKVIFPITTDDFTEEMEAAFAWARTNKFPIQIVAIEEEKPDLAVTAALGHGYEEFDGGENVGEAIVGMLADAEGDVRFLLFLNTEEDVDAEAGIAALDAGVDAYNLADGLDKIDAEEDESAAEAEPEPEPEEAPKRGRRGSAEAAAVAVEPTTGHPTSLDDPRMNPDSLKTFLMAELKEIAKSIWGADVMTADVMRGKTKDVLVEYCRFGLPSDAAEDEEQEEQEEVAEEPVEAPKRGRRGAATREPAAEPEDAADEAQTQVVHAPEGMTLHVLDSTDLDSILAAITGALEALAVYVVEEIRKPKPRGRPKVKTD